MGLIQPASVGLPSTVTEFVSVLNRELKGKQLEAFGRDDKGHWGHSEIPVMYTISSVETPYYDEEGEEDDDQSSPTLDIFVSLNVYLLEYRWEQYGHIYTSKKFYEQFMKLLADTSVASQLESVHYSEQGMQGRNFVNFDVTVKLPRTK